MPLLRLDPVWIFHKPTSGKAAAEFLFRSRPLQPYEAGSHRNPAFNLQARLSSPIYGRIWILSSKLAARADQEVVIRMEK
jgi:hypothetical protein